MASALKWHQDRSIRRFASGLPLVIALVLATWSATAEEATEQSPPAPAVPIEPSDIPIRATTVTTSLSDTEELLNRTELLESIETRLDKREQQISRNLVSLRRSLAAASSRQALTELEQQWTDAFQTLTDWGDELRRVQRVLEKELERLTSLAEVWAISLEQVQQLDTGAELVQLTRSTSGAVEDTLQSLQLLQGRIFRLQGRVARAQASVQTALDRIRDEEENLLANLLERDGPALWSDAVRGSTRQGMLERATTEASATWESIRNLASDEHDRLIFQLLLLVALGLVLRRAGRANQEQASVNVMVDNAGGILNRPFSIAAVVILLLTPKLYPALQPAIYDVVGLLMLVPILRIIAPLLERRHQPFLYFLAGLYLLDWIRDLLEGAPLVARYIFLIEMLGAVLLALQMLRSKALNRTISSRLQSQIHLGLHLGLYAAVGLTAAAALAAAAGFVRLGVLLGTGVLNSAYLAIFFVAVVRAAGTLITISLQSRLISNFHSIAQNRQTLNAIATAALKVIAIVVWLYVSLDHFALQDSTIQFFNLLLFSEVKAGAIAMSLADMLAFVATIIVAVLLARLIVIILEADLYPRLALGRGVAFAVSAVIKYSLITVGFLLAVGAMGIGMDRITILLGAFGVGLGFGLQTIINSFVSGMILIFERPVQVGDSVEIGSVKGVITRIGIRSSTIRSFEGAEITIPNGTLLSDALTNWTMSDKHRRIQVEVGVAYGTNPDTVIEHLKEAVAQQEGLLEQPRPVVLFTGFGDSSLNFLLRAWVEDNDEYVSIQSELALQVNRILSDNGIEIPFPQRDLHVRSMPGAQDMSDSER